MLYFKRESSYLNGDSFFIGGDGYEAKRADVLPEIQGFLYRIAKPSTHCTSWDFLELWWKAEIKHHPELGKLGDVFQLYDPKPVRNFETAFNILKTVAIPYCGAVAVAFKGLIGGKPAELLAAEQALIDADIAWAKTVGKIHSSLLDCEIDFIQCWGCLSYIAKTYIGEGCWCPVCNASLVDAAAQEERKNALHKRNDAEALVNTFNSEVYPAEHTGTCFLIGGWTE